MSNQEIQVMDNGPLLVKGQDICVKDGEGNEFATEGETVALCRCGLSQNKPFCDGAHSGQFDSQTRSGG